MATRRRDISQEEARKRREEVIARKLEQAKQPDSRVVRLKSNDCIAMMSILGQLDNVVITLRKRMGLSVSMAEAEPLLNEFKDTMKNLSDFAKKISDFMGFEYTEPKIFENELDNISTKD